MTLIIDLQNRLLNTAHKTIFNPETRTWSPLDGQGGKASPGDKVNLTGAVRWLQKESGHPCRVPVGIIGGRSAEPRQLDAAETLGGLIGNMGLTLICGGRQGIMEAACRGASRAGGVSVGLLPDEDPSSANPYVTIPLATGIGVARNALLTRAALCLTAVGGGYGTLSEIAYGMQFGKPVFGLAGAPEVAGMHRCETPEAAAEGIARAVLNLPE